MLAELLVISNFEKCDVLRFTLDSQNPAIKWQKCLIWARNNGLKIFISFCFENRNFKFKTSTRDFK